MKNLVNGGNNTIYGIGMKFHGSLFEGSKIAIKKGIRVHTLSISKPKGYIPDRFLLQFEFRSYPEVIKIIILDQKL